MTGREHLSGRKRWATGGVVVGVVLLVSGLLIPLLAGADAGGLVMTMVVVPGVVLLVGTVLAVQRLLFWCPWCRSNLGALLAQKGMWRIDPKVRFCPYCGTDLDDPVGAAADWDAPVE